MKQKKNRYRIPTNYESDGLYFIILYFNQGRCYDFTYKSFLKFNLEKNKMKSMQIYKELLYTYSTVYVKTIMFFLIMQLNINSYIILK